jgi:hypothetical protein
MSSNTKRLWVIDMNEKKYCSIHWLHTEKIQAKNLLRIFLTRKVRSEQLRILYHGCNVYGDNGYSLRLLGMDKGLMMQLTEEQS